MEKEYAFPSFVRRFIEFSYHLIPLIPQQPDLLYLTKPSCKESWSFTCVTIPRAKIKLIFVKELEKLFDRYSEVSAHYLFKLLSPPFLQVYFTHYLLLQGPFIQIHFSLIVLLGNTNFRAETILLDWCFHMERPLHMASLHTIPTLFEEGMNC